MREISRGLVAVALTLLLVVSMTGSAVALQSPAAGSADNEFEEPTGTTTQSSENITRTQRHKLQPETPGQVQTTVIYDLPDRMQSMNIQLLNEGTVTSTEGFDRVNETTYEWDETSARPQITIEHNPNETASGDDRLRYADAGDWALIREFDIYETGEWDGDDMFIEYNGEAEGPGAGGNEIVYLGEVSTYERTANGQRFRLVVPERAELFESPEDILDSLANASASLDVGDRDPEVFGFAAPTGEIEWAVRGTAFGDSDFWVADVERLDDPENVWIHEYVHTRQSYEPTNETEWVTEGSADYYASLLTLEQGWISFWEFRADLAEGGYANYSDVVLSNQSTWRGDANYDKGALAAGRIDTSLRTATNGDRTFEGTFRELNDVDGPVTQAKFLRLVERAGGAESRATAVRYTETTAPLSVWDQETHTRLFESSPGTGGETDNIVDVYDTNDDGKISLAELGVAGSDYTKDDITLSQLADVASAYVSS